MSPAIAYNAHMLYFAYGSNMSISRLRERTPSAVPLGCHRLEGYDLRFHKSGGDGSGKCDAYRTANPADSVYGALYTMDPADKPSLDRAEGLGYGYEESEVILTALDGALVTAVTYVAIRIDAELRPYTWYLNHVLIGARQTPLPDEYIREKIHPVEALEDADRRRDAQQRAIHGQ